MTNKDISIIKNLSEPFYVFVNRRKLEEIDKDLVSRLLYDGLLIDSPPNLIITRELYDKIKKWGGQYYGDSSKIESENTKNIVSDGIEITI